MVAAPRVVAESVPPSAAPLIGPAPVPAPADPRKEYIAVAGGGLAGLAGTLAASARALPLAADAVQRDFGLDIWEQVARDPQVTASLNAWIAGALSQPATVQPSLPEANPDYAQNVKEAQFCQQNFDRLRRPLDATLHEIAFAALTNGHKTVELVWDTATWDAAVGPQIILRALKPKPLRSVAFVVDPYQNEIGKLVARPGQPLTQTTVYVGDGTDLIPPEKAPTLTLNGQDGDPRGQSALRCIYGWWWFKQQVYPEYLKYQAQFASGVVIGTAAPGAGEYPQTQADGSVINVSATQAMADVVAGLHNGAFAVLPNGATIDIKRPNGNGEAFQEAIRLADAQITKGLLAQTLATNEGATRGQGTRASAAVHQDILGLMIRSLKTILAAWLQRAVLVPLVRYNFGDAAVARVPWVSLGQTDPQDFASALNAIAQAAAAGFWQDPIMPPAIRAKLSPRLGLPVDNAAGPDGIVGTPDDVDDSPPPEDSQPLDAPPGRGGGGGGR